jgi:NADPH2:quinone reductase
LCLVAGGGYAEYALAPAATALPVPAGLSLAEAAAMPETLFTVWVNLFERGFAGEGDWALVHGGTSGIGTMAIALCRLLGRQGDRDLRQRRQVRGGATAWGRRRPSTIATQDFAEEVRT